MKHIASVPPGGGRVSAATMRVGFGWLTPPSVGSRTVCSGVPRDNYLNRHGVELAHGDARPGPDRTVIVRDEHGAERVLRARVVLLATGSRPYHPRGIPFDDPDVHDSETVLSIERPPERVVVIGGGPVGCEYASILTALGVQVTPVDRGTPLLPLLDGELSATLAHSLKRSGAPLMLGAHVEAVERDADGPQRPRRRGDPAPTSRPARGRPRQQRRAARPGRGGREGR